MNQGVGLRHIKSNATKSQQLTATGVDLYRNNRDDLHPTQVRKIRPTRRSVSGIYAFRGEAAIAFESTLERDFLIRTEFFQSVLEVIPQPVEIPFLAQTGARYTYTPDFLVYYRLGNRSYDHYPKPVLIEVKPEADWRKHWREWMPKWKAARRFAQSQGWEFHIQDETRIRDLPFQNIKFLERYKRMQFPIEESLCVLKTVAEMGVVTMDHLLARHFMGNYRAEGIAHIWHLLATRQLECDIGQSLGHFIELWVPSND